jgi:hypothetical protein
LIEDVAIVSRGWYARLPLGGEVDDAILIGAAVEIRGVGPGLYAVAFGLSHGLRPAHAVDGLEREGAIDGLVPVG